MLLISYDISFNFEMKRKKKKVYLLQNKRKNIGTCPQGIEPGSADSKSNFLTPLVLRHSCYAILIWAYLAYTLTWGVSIPKWFRTFCWSGFESWWMRVFLLFSLFFLEANLTFFFFLFISKLNYISVLRNQKLQHTILVKDKIIL